MTKRGIAIEFSDDEVIVLYEWLRRHNESAQPGFVDQAEQRAAWDLEASLEAVNPALFAGDYLTRLEAARNQVRDPVE